MKRIAVLSVLLFVCCPVGCEPQQPAACEPRQSYEVTEFELDEFNDFFAIDDSRPRCVQEPSKEKMSRAKIFMIWLGIKCAMAAESFYTWITSLWASFLYYIGYSKHEAADE